MKKRYVGLALALICLSTAQAGSPVGYLDVANCDVIQGWALGSSPNAKMSVQIWRDGLPNTGGTQIASGTADTSLSFLPPKFEGHAFSIPTPDSTDQNEHTIYAVGVDPAKPAAWFQLSRWQNNKRTSNPYSLKCKPILPKGYLSLVNCSKLEGWAMDSYDPAAVIKVQLWKDGMPGTGVKVAEFMANQTLPRLPDIYKGHGYSIDTPTGLKAGGTEHKIYAVGVNLAKPDRVTQLKSWRNETTSYDPFPIQCKAPAPNPDAIKPTDLTGNLALYRLKWNDEFQGDSLDLNEWEYRTDGFYASQNQAANVTVANGNLVIAGKAEKVGDLDYTSGGIISKKYFRDGYYESRIKLPKRAGWHSSFWTMAYRAPTGSAMEWDFLEQNSWDTFHYTSNIHRHLLNGVADHKTVSSLNIGSDEELWKNYHVWGGEIVGNEIRYYFDGKLAAVVKAEKDKQGNTLIMNDQNIWLTTIAFKNSTIEAPAYVLFDWVRFYEK